MLLRECAERKSCCVLSVWHVKMTDNRAQKHGMPHDVLKNVAMCICWTRKVANGSYAVGKSRRGNIRIRRLIQFSSEKMQEKTRLFGTEQTTSKMLGDVS
jgi:hypothetical protein